MTEHFMTDLGFRSKRIEWLAIVALLLTAPAYLFPGPRTLWFVLVFPLVWAVRAVLRRRLFNPTLADWGLGLLLVQVFATCLIVPDLNFSLPKITGILLGVFVFYALTALLGSEILLKIGCGAFLALGTAFAAIGMLGVTWDYDSLVFSLARLVGIHLDKTVYTRRVIPALDSILPRLKLELPGAEEGFNGNAIGGVLILILPLGLSLLVPYLSRRRAAERMVRGWVFGLLAALALVVLSGSLFLSLAVGSWLALGVSVWAVFFSRRWKVITAAVLLAAAAVVLFLLPSRAADVGRRIGSELDPEKVEYRLKWWAVGLETIRRHPLFGIGMNRIRLHPDIGYARSHVHNHFLQIAAELGIPGLAAYLLILAAAASMCVRIWKRATAGWMRRAALGLGGGQLAHGIFGLFDSIPLGAKVGLFFWISLSLIVALDLHTAGRKAASVRSD